ncbi:sensor histidine kinase [Paenibacillus arenosi]|uniref:histidine kinase n=1 Tax=Paenibacillus arenosi TaxID=2774142 RepID=A0ABR9B0L5_9BACL|nr:HAMP domain-containing sensor histidine kinase [Paenibacillus arenosi]MBD8499812.1 HAMP domain-containing histidine kinase [Paenibacillus arenosi]
MSIRLRLTVWYSALLAFTLFVFGISIYAFVDYNIYSDIKNRLKHQTKQMSVQSTVKWNGDISFDIFVPPNSDNSFEELYIQTYNYTSKEYRFSENLQDLRMKFPYPSSPKDVQEGYKRLNVSGNEFYVYHQPIDIGGEVVGLIQVGAYTGDHAAFFKLLRTILIFASMVTVVIAFSLGLFLAQKSLRPIENIIRATNRVQKGADLSVRIPREGPPEDEIGQLTETINSMLGRMETFYNELDDAYRAQRRFVSDASHELRTPLTTIRGNVDLLEKMWSTKNTNELPLTEDEREQMSEEALRDIGDEARRMSNLVNDMLSLARADAGYKVEKEVVEVKGLIEEVVRRAQFLPRTSDWIFEENAELSNKFVRGNKDYLQQMLFIFIENAFKYTPSGSVELIAVVQNDQLGLRIKDSGIGMDEHEVPHIFERFYRADVSRGITSGTGLGLSIAKWIIDEHGGSVEVMTQPGEGTTFIVWLPLVHIPDEWIMEPTEVGDVKSDEGQ